MYGLFGQVMEMYLNLKKKKKTLLYGFSETCGETAAWNICSKLALAG